MKDLPMSDNTQIDFNRGGLVLLGLRVAVLATISALVGVLAHVAWKVMTA